MALGRRLPRCTLLPARPGDNLLRGTAAPAGAFDIALRTEGCEPFKADCLGLGLPCSGMQEKLLQPFEKPVRMFGIGPHGRAISAVFLVLSE